MTTDSPTPSSDPIAAALAKAKQAYADASIACAIYEATCRAKDEAGRVLNKADSESTSADAAYVTAYVDLHGGSRKDAYAILREGEAAGFIAHERAAIKSDYVAAVAAVAADFRERFLAVAGGR